MHKLHFAFFQRCRHLFYSPGAAIQQGASATPPRFSDAAQGACNDRRLWLCQQRLVHCRHIPAPASAFWRRSRNDRHPCVPYRACQQMHCCRKCRHLFCFHILSVSYCTPCLNVKKILPLITIVTIEQHLSSSPCKKDTVLSIDLFMHVLHAAQ